MILVPGVRNVLIMSFPTKNSWKNEFQKKIYFWKLYKRFIYIEIFGKNYTGGIITFGSVCDRLDDGVEFSKVKKNSNILLSNFLQTVETLLNLLLNIFLLFIVYTILKIL